MDAGAVTRTLVQFGLALLVAGGVLAWITSTIYRSDARFQTWQTTDATILTSTLVRQFDPAMSSGTNNMQQLYWMISVSYRYTVDGVNYTGMRYSNSPPRVSADGETLPPASLSAIQTRLAPGTIVPIRYAPNRPQSSYIEIKYGGWRWPLLVVAALLIAALMAFGLALRR